MVQLIEYGEFDDLEELRLDVGDKFRGILVRIKPVPHYVFGSKTEIEQHLVNGVMVDKEKWILVLRREGATDAADDLEFWTQNQTKREVNDELIKAGVDSDHINGTIIGIERMPDRPPRTPGYRGATQLRVVIITAGPDGWVDPLTDHGDYPTRMLPSS